MKSTPRRSRSTPTVWATVLPTALLVIMPGVLFCCRAVPTQYRLPYREQQFQAHSIRRPIPYLRDHFVRGRTWSCRRSDIECLSFDSCRIILRAEHLNCLILNRSKFTWCGKIPATHSCVSTASKVENDFQTTRRKRH
jgi:hypothetical protein